MKILSNINAWFTAFIGLAGILVGYWIKDNYGKADEQTNIEIKNKKGVINTDIKAENGPELKKFRLFRKYKHGKKKAE
jgi:hypothetical protein